MEYQKEKFRTLSCFVKPPWLSEVKRVVGIKKLCWSVWKLLGYEHWAVDRLDQVDRVGKVFGRLTWDHNVNSGSRHWLSVSSQSFYWQGVAESQRAQIIWIIWAIWHWIDSHSYSALPLPLLRILFVFKAFTQSLMISTFGCRKFQFVHSLLWKGKEHASRSHLLHLNN